MSTPGFDSASVAELAEQNTKLKKSFEAPGAWEKAIQLAEADLEAARAVGARILCVLDAEYPALLQKTPDCPFFLYVQGSWSVDAEKVSQLSAPDNRPNTAQQSQAVSPAI